MPLSGFRLPATLFLLTTTSLSALHPANAQEIKLKEIVVTGDAVTSGESSVFDSDDYVPISGRSATKTDTPFHQVPQTISAVTQTQLQERKPSNLLEILSYTPGAYVNQYGFDPRFDMFKLRGIDMGYTGIFRDGLRQYNTSNGVFRLEPYGLQAATIVKGPSGSLYGASSAGGIIDLISKRPSEVPLREIQLQTGSFRHAQTAIDFTGPANAENTLLYRMTGLWRKADTELGDAVKNDRFYIAPAITWQPDNDTRFTILSNFMDATTGGTAAYANKYDPITGKNMGATHEFAGDARFNKFYQKQAQIGYELDQRIAENIMLHQRLRYSYLTAKQQYVFANTPGIGDETNQGFATDTYLEADLQTGQIAHKLIGGLDFNTNSSKSFSGYGTKPFTATTYVPAFTTEDRQQQRGIGIYLQDQLELDAWRLTLGLRHDWLKSDLQTGAYQARLDEYSRSDSKTTGRAALAYVIDSGLTPYIGYGTSFVPNASVLEADANAIRRQALPTTGRQIEAGLKYAIPSTNAYINAAIFRIDQDNATIFETSSGINHPIQLDLRSQGFELEAVGKFDNGFSLTASYAYNDVTIRRLTEQTVGNTLNASPYHTASIWAGYDFESGPLFGLGLNAGVRYTGSSFGDNIHSVQLNNQPRFIVDAAIRYDLGQLAPTLKGTQIQVNATNLLNEVKQICSSGYCYWDKGRSVLATLQYRF